MAKSLFSRHPQIKRIVLGPANIIYRLNNKLGLSLIFFLKHKKIPRIDNPQTFGEKIQWIKLNYRTKLYPIVADKFTVRDYVKSQGLGHLLNDLYWQGDNAKDIPFADLPEKFVAKATHGCGFNIICFDKSMLNIEQTIMQLEKWKSMKYLECYGEWFYGVVAPSIICESFIEGETEDSVPMDFKIHCFNGVPKMVFVDNNRFSEKHYRNVYDIEWNYHDVMFGIQSNSSCIIERPVQLEEMLEYAKILAKPFPYVRIDFYISKGQIIFGEITLTNGAGFTTIRPKSFDKKLGDWITLPDKIHEI